MKTVYVETSILSYLTARPARDVLAVARQQMTREWWDTRRSRFDLFVSPLVEHGWETSMKADPILKELWEIKDGLAAECDHDLRRLFDRLKASQEDRGLPMANRTRRRAQVAEPEGPDYGS